MKIFAFIGSVALNITNTFGGLIIMLGSTLRWMVRPPFRLRLLLVQMESIGVNSTPIVILTGMFTGMVFAYQCYFGFHQFGLEYMTGAIVAIAVARELGPVLSGIMVIARSGSAITAELSSMKVTEQVDALYVLAVEPVQYLVVPRVLAGVIMMPMLSLISVFFGIVGGYFVGVKILGINSTLYMDNMINFLTMSDVMNGTIKAMVFGLLMALVGCYKGLNSSGGAVGVGKATTESVVLSCILVLLFDYILTAMMF